MDLPSHSETTLSSPELVVEAVSPWRKMNRGLIVRGKEMKRK
jgi:hypothetical protein